MDSSRTIPASIDALRRIAAEGAGRLLKFPGDRTPLLVDSFSGRAAVSVFDQMTDRAQGLVLEQVNTREGMKTFLLAAFLRRTDPVHLPAPDRATTVQKNGDARSPGTGTQ